MRAAELLASDHPSVKQAALLVGYQSIPNFTRDFKRRFAMKSAEYYLTSKSAHVASALHDPWASSELPCIRE